MNAFKQFKWLRLTVICLLALMLTGCLEWLRVYKTYWQLDEFDTHFAIESKDDFSILFKHPLILSNDFIVLSKLQPSDRTILEQGKRWRYLFKKVNDKGEILQPETQFFFDLTFNRQQLLTQWTFSPLFLQIAPADFLEASLRSIAGADINEGKRQLRANKAAIEKIASKLPQRATVVAQLGEPLEITTEKETEVYRYHFMLQTPKIEEGYEDRALNAVRLTFDLKTHELVKMSGRFAGLKVSINYRNYQEETDADS